MASGVYIQRKELPMKKTDLLIVREPLMATPYVAEAPAGIAQVGDMVTFDTKKNLLQGVVIDLLPGDPENNASRCVRHVAAVYVAKRVYRRIWEQPSEQLG